MKRIFTLILLLTLLTPALSLAGEKERVAARLFGPRFEAQFFDTGGKEIPPILMRQLKYEWPYLKQELVELFCEAFTIEELKQQERAWIRDEKYTTMLMNGNIKEIVKNGRSYLQNNGLDKERLLHVQAMLDATFFYGEETFTLQTVGLMEGMISVSEKRRPTRREYSKMHKMFSGTMLYFKRNTRYISAWMVASTPKHVIDERIAEYQSGTTVNWMKKYNSVAQRVGFAMGKCIAQAMDIVGIPIRKIF